MNKTYIFILLGLGALIGVGVILFLVFRDTTTQPATITEPPIETDIVDGVDTTATTSENLFPEDNDRDGITNEDEKTLGLDSTNFDTDGDGLADAFELQVTKTDPLVADSDGDGIPDGREYLTFETNPNEADSDGDGYDDATEIDNGFNPNGDGTL